MNKPLGPRIGTLDIETAPIQSYHWGLFDQNIGLEQIHGDWSILAFCGKWLDDKKVVYQDTGGRGVKKVRDDAPLLKSIWEFLDKADIVVGQNVRRFDLKKINSRLIQAGYGPYSPVRVIDTLEVAKRTFAFTSNKLAWTSLQLTDEPKSTHKKFPGFELWSECLKDNAEAWAEMRRYNIRDVTATEKLYLKLRPWIVNHPNLGVYIGDHDHHVCPSCGSVNTQRRGRATTQAFQYWRWQCQDCGSWSKERLRIKGSGSK